MLYRIIDVEARSNYRVWIRFGDGTEGVVDLSDLAGKGVFERCKDPGEFDEVFVDEDAGTIAWPGGLDVAPDRLYRDLKPVSTTRTRSG
ncbi:MAG TPA: DUF2442 domain-containing protein [Gemmatimonadota bacterium]|nr:DUF2442 domain-containing protein [Gemmatimonadota bacterium]